MNIFIRFFSIIVIGCFLFVSQSFAETAKITGTVVGVHDGDTITVLTSEKKSLKIRLAEIDAPELKQPYGQKAKQSLSGLVFERKVTVEVRDIDRYGRSVGVVYRGETNVNQAMVSLGMAWAYRQYLKDAALLDIEAKAKSNKAGLWGLPETEQIPPWEWRHPSSTKTKQTEVSNPAISACGTKLYCKQMSSCAEALHYLRDCRLPGLDGDHDGIPCEALCK